MASEVLFALDSAATQCYHFKTIVVSGMGLFTDAYDLFCIVLVTKLIGRIYYDKNDGNPGVMPPLVVSAMIGFPLLGTVIGQILFGWLGDKIGRRRVYGVALSIIIFGSIGSGLSIGRTKKCVLTSLSFFRFLLGIGIGGDYPLSATIMSEYSNRTTRGAFIAAVFSMQGFGILVSSAVTVALSAVFDKASKATGKFPPPDEADLLWRLILIFGAVPAALTFYWRMMLPETARYTALVEQNVRQAVKDMEKVLALSLHRVEDNTEAAPSQPTYTLFSREFLRHHGKDLFACTSSWFLVDIVFYSNTLFQSLIYKAALRKPINMNAYQEVIRIARLQAIIAICSLIPGYWATVLFIDRVGRVKIQTMGFFLMALALFAIGIPYDFHWKHHINAGFFVLYGLIFFFSNFGPNTTTFIVPAELFPARFRSTCHGISGAAGKVGAIIGSIGFLWASQSTDENEVEKGYIRGIGMEASLIILGGICVVGGVLSYFFTPETTGRSLEENEIDDDKGMKEMRDLRLPTRTDRSPSEISTVVDLVPNDTGTAHNQSETNRAWWNLFLG
ncbi:probable inorganic phosphate transporter 1-10 [Aristolochia californica]|uniref:probable inorganic phosphate transporter 1-10 n=1 Tax=Aristolochia californica TaxID=171875 RepID=UPI0035D5F303